MSETAIYTTEESWTMTEPDKVVAIIREVECWRLGNWEGCCCSSFNIRNVDVDISCGKGREQAVWVSSQSMDYEDPDLLTPIMAEVIRQVTEGSGRSGEFKQYIGETYVPNRRSPPPVARSADENERIE